MKCNPSEVIKIAEAEIGYKEKATNSDIYEKTANSGSNNWNKYANDIDTKYPDFYNGKKNGYDWCDIFVDWCFIQAYGVEDAKRLLCQPDHSLGAGCEYSYNYFKQNGQTGSSPKLGAQIFFGDLDHTGIVVDFNDEYVWTVEGNSGNEVKKNRYSRDNSWIYGYGYPKYDEEVTPKPTPAPSGDIWTGEYPKLPNRGYYLTGDGYETCTDMQDDIKLIQGYLKWALDLSNDFLVDGFYGEKTTAAVAEFQKVAGFTKKDIDGSYGKKTLAAAKVFTKTDEVSEMKEIKASNKAEKRNPKLAKTYTVNAQAGLNIRDGAGTDYKILVAIPYGTKVKNYGYYTENDGNKWLYITFEYNDVKYTGFASSQWLS